MRRDHHLHHCYVSQFGEITTIINRHCIPLSVAPPPSYDVSQCGEGEVRNMSSPTECQEAPQFHLDYSNPWCTYHYYLVTFIGYRVK